MFLGRISTKTCLNPKKSPSVGALHPDPLASGSKELCPQTSIQVK